MSDPIVFWAVIWCGLGGLFLVMCGIVYGSAVVAGKVEDAGGWKRLLKMALAPFTKWEGIR